MVLSQRARALAPSPTMAVDAKAKRMLQEGADLVNFSVGEPDFDTPTHIKEAAKQALDQGYTKYTPAAGALDLRKAIARKLLAENGLEYRPEQIVVSNGAKQSLYNTFQVLLNPGDEVIVQAPYWVSYPEMVKLADGVPVIIETDESTGFKMTPDMIRSRLTSRTRIINLNSPSNPTGAVYSEAELKAIAELAVARGLIVLTDEIYEKMVYDGVRHVSIASFGPEIKRLTVTINGMSKAFAMTGWRIGYAAAEPELAKAMDSLQSQSTSGPNTIAQMASIPALSESAASISEMVAEFDRRRRYAVQRLQAMPGIRLDAVPPGAFYVFPNVSGLFGANLKGRRIQTSDDFAMALLEEVFVALVPGSGFGAGNYVRISYATSMERLQTGLDRMESLIRSAQ